MRLIRISLIVLLIALGGCGRKPAPAKPVAQPAPVQPAVQPQPVQPVVQPVQASPVQASWLGGVSTRVEGAVSVRFVPTPRSEDVSARIYWEAPNADPNAYFVGLDKQGMPLVVDRRHKGMNKGFVDDFRRNLERVDKWVLM